MTGPARRETRGSRYMSCVALSYAALIASSVIIAVPTVAALSSAGVPRLPDGDRALFEPGSLLLLEVLRLGWERLTRGLWASAVLAIMTSAVTLPVSAAVMVRLANEKPLPWQVWLARTRNRIPAFFMLGAVAMLARASIVVLMAVSAAHSHDVLLVAFGTKPADVALLAAGLVALLATLVLGCCHDLARAVAIEKSAFGWDALRGGFVLLRRHPGRCLVPWFVAVGGALAAALIVAWTTARLDLYRPGAWRPSLEFLVAQAAVAMALTTRVWWFDRALRLAHVLD